MLSGLAGAVIQDFLPRAMRIRPGQEVRREDVDAAIHELYVEAEEAILGRSEALVQTYLKTIRPVLLGSRSQDVRLFTATLTGADPAAPVGARLRALAAPPGEGQTWEKLVTIAERKVRLEHNDFDLMLSVALAADSYRTGDYDGRLDRLSHRWGALLLGSMTGRARLLLAGYVALALIAFFIVPRGSYQPGKLLAAHAGFNSQCAACHRPWHGVDNRGCIACHGDFSQNNPHGGLRRNRHRSGRTTRGQAPGSSSRITT